MSKTKTTNAKRIDPLNHLKLRLNPDGSLTRLAEITPADPNPNPNPQSGDVASSKDVVLNPTNKTFLRIFKPIDVSSARLPIILHFHSSGWVLNRSTGVINHHSCSRTAAKVPALVISVDYRLAPEHRLPAQYDDAVDAILWVKKQASDPNGEPWLKSHADFSRCYIYGCGNGGNIAFHAALRALEIDLSPMRIAGNIFYQPTFGGRERTASELSNVEDQWTPLSVQDFVWEQVLPKGADRDHPFCNPTVQGLSNPKIAGLGRCLVIGCAGDIYFDRQQELVKMLLIHGVRVDAQFDSAGFHLIETVDPLRALRLLDMVREFVRAEPQPN